jgi:DNA-binding transcriptional LysR family regulator
MTYNHELSHNQVLQNQQHSTGSVRKMTVNIQSLRQFDLNSLVTLQVLLEEKHVTHAANKLNLTQSAVSRTLSKLRDAFDDPLLVKSGKHLALTTKAERLKPTITAILQQISNVLEPEAFDPLKHTGTIRLATTDYGTHTLLPKLIPLLAEQAPNVQLSAVDWPTNLLTDLEENNVDLIIGGTKEPPADIFQRVLARDHFQGLVRKDHPIPETITLDDYLELNHIMISPSGQGSSTVDNLLEKMGHHRKVSVRVPHFFAAIEVLANTDYMILLPSHFIRRYVDLSKFRVVEPPFDIPTMEVSMFWHARMHQDPLHKWFRNFVYEHIYNKNK